MNAVFERKNSFMKLVKQMSSEDLVHLKPHVAEIHKLIDLYCLTHNETYLKLLEALLRKCNTAMTYRLIEDNNKKFNSLFNLYCISEIYNY
ncbi:hypothetical protein [Erinnyis ello granulovirus]|uniref:Uncharacterized protein n=1 Tax=Erinnyis ello granulovirus TaxID=307444 RepID=A0A097DAL1_9BBAC|nr:hypothetical protein [Erinnyis ello granulovirus]AIS92035.1 hypothetical protein [Erinnyis ello granulovirus]ARX71374.1 hypothetical protein EREL_035 [Erinnyis ello granulovirus]ARX71504.1 hypothetical protein EREL_035 [Erinnyis ello granulovirus]ARX71634.1 hypothetical protein EREL_035 [Erinnyis ello granulovirus]ARX71764.1 hypothetical protein EREL_035 [Erinnyis ello granulovirus]